MKKREAAQTNLNDKTILNSKSMTYMNVFMFGFLICFFLMLVHILRAPVPRETVLEMFPVVDKMYSGELMFSDLLTKYAEHGMLAENILMLLNAKIFNFSMLAEYSVCAVCIALIGYTLLSGMNRSLTETAGDGQKKTVFFILFSTLIFFLSNNNFAAGMNNQVRLSLLTSIVAAGCADRCIRSAGWSRFALAAAALVLAINICGTFYSFAMIPAVLMVWIIYAVKNPYKNRLQLILLSVLCVVLIIGYLAEYQLMMFSPADGGKSMNDRIFSSLGGILGDLKETGKSLLAWCGNSLLGHYLYNAHLVPDRLFLLIGAAMLGVSVFSIIIYIRRKIYRLTWIPVFLMGYSLCLFIELLIGRPMGWDWSISAWYSIHSRMLAVGCIWILGAAAFRRGSSRAFRIILSTTLVIVVAVSGAALVRQIGDANQSKQTDWDELPYLYISSAKDMPVNEKGLTPLSAPLNSTMKAINTMRKHHLGVYRYEEGYEKMMAIVAKDTVTNYHTKAVEPARYPRHLFREDWSGEYVSGIYEDGWAGKEVRILACSGETGTVAISGYYPLKTDGSQVVHVTVNGKAADDYPIDQNSFVLYVYSEQETDTEITLTMDFSGKSEDSQDDRDLCFLITEIEAM